MSYLYVISHPKGWCKIGRAIDPAKRLRQHQAHSGAALKGEAIFPCTDPSACERIALGMLGSYRIMGEWFDIDVEKACEAAQEATGSKAAPFPAVSFTNNSRSILPRKREEDAILDHLRHECPKITETQMYRLLVEEDQFHLWIEAHGGTNGRRWAEYSEHGLIDVRRSLLRKFLTRTLSEARASDATEQTIAAIKAELDAVPRGHTYA